MLDRIVPTTAAVKIVAVNRLETAEDASQAAALVQALHTLRSEAEEHRKAMKAPHLDAGRAVDDQFREPLKELDRVIGMLKARLSERALALDTARALALSQGPVEANAALATMPDERYEKISERWSWEVTGYDLSQVPVQYLTLDTAKVKEAIKAADREARQPRIPGITFDRKVLTVVRK